MIGRQRRVGDGLVVGGLHRSCRIGRRTDRACLELIREEDMVVEVRRERLIPFWLILLRPCIRVYTVVSGRLNVVKGLKRTNQIVSLKRT